MTLDNQRVLQYTLYGLGLVVWFVVWKFLGSVTDLILVVRHLPQVDVPGFGNLNNLYALVALGITAGAVEYARRHAVANKFGIEVIAELRKVTWPNWAEVRGTTVVVLGVTLAVSLILFAFDSVYDFLIRALFKLA
ncbi:MAG TPA: preprotein translocase subunit SecE [bacterium]|nr:preprotein translocase subunit SecE [bacterium]